MNGLDVAPFNACDREGETLEAGAQQIVPGW